MTRVLKEVAMRTIRLGANFAVFVLFFGVATLEALQTKNWLKAAFWLLIGIAFLVNDNLKQQR
jgi:hypothetical protein